MIYQIKIKLNSLNLPCWILRGGQRPFVSCWSNWRLRHCCLRGTEAVSWNWIEISLTRKDQLMRGNLLMVHFLMVFITWQHGNQWIQWIMSGYLSMVFIVGRTFSLAERETKKEKGTNQRHIVKYAITWKMNSEMTKTAQQMLLENRVKASLTSLNG